MQLEFLSLPVIRVIDLKYNYTIIIDFEVKNGNVAFNVNIVLMQIVLSAIIRLQ